MMPNISRFISKSQTKLNHERPLIIGVCGRSCSGKSEATRALEQLYPHKVLRIPADRFFKVSNPPAIHEEFGWESPSSIRWDRLIYSVKKLKAGLSTHIPSKGWTEIFDHLVHPKPIIVVEGYLIFTNKELTQLFDKKIFFDIDDLNILYRRTLREKNVESMHYIMHKVIPISKKYENTQKKVADIVIDGNKPKNEVREAIHEVLKKCM